MQNFHILIVLSTEPEIIYLLSLVTATVKTSKLCPCKTFSCLFCKRFHTLNENSTLLASGSADNSIFV